MPWDMNTFQQQLLDLAAEAEAAGAEELDPNKFDSLIEGAAREHAAELLTDIRMILADRRSFFAGFQERLRARWGPALALFELVLYACTEIGADYNTEFRAAAIDRQDFRFDALVQLHGRAMLTGSEILALLESGHADGAMGRWRTLHEINVVGAFLREQSIDVSYRYLMHELVERYKSFQTYQANYQELGYEAPEQGEQEEWEKTVERLRDDFEPTFTRTWGWAFPVFDHVPTFREIEEASGLAFMRPYYRLAGDFVHTSPRALMHGLQKMSDDSMLVAGPSNAGLVDPGHGAVVSMMKITGNLMKFVTDELVSDEDSNEQRLVFVLTLQLLLELSDKAGHAFLECANRLESDERKRQETEGDLTPPKGYGHAMQYSFGASGVFDTPDESDEPT